MVTSKQTCLITGCSSGGIGATLAEAFRDKGYHVFATARSPSKIPDTLQNASNVTLLALDVSSTPSIKAAAEAVSRETRGTLDVLINNAGHGMNMPLLDASIAESKQLFDTNFFGVLETVQVFAPLLVKAKGCIVNNSSLGGFQAFPFNGIKLQLFAYGYASSLIPRRCIRGLQSSTDARIRDPSPGDGTARRPCHHALDWRSSDQIPVEPRNSLAARGFLLPEC